MKLEFAKKAIIQSQLQFMCGSNFYETDVNTNNCKTSMMKSNLTKVELESGQ